MFRTVSVTRALISALFIPAAFITFTLFIASCAAYNQKSPAEAAGEYNPVKINQIGYLPEEEKIVYSSAASREFLIRNAESGEILYSGEMKYSGYDEDTGMDIHTGDFSDFRKEGRFVIEVTEAGESYPFSIAQGVYDDVMKLSSRFFCYQRSGTDIHINDVQGTVIKPGHMKKAFLWDDSSVTQDVSGGWYDAGDFGRYIPTAAFSVKQLLYAFTFNPGGFTDGSLEIPESGNGVPDLIDEIEWELSWMLGMQREDGAVYHKVTTRDYPEMGTPPSEDNQDLFIFGPTSSDTAYFTAAMAAAARVMEPWDATFAETCRAAALKSWNWLKDNPGQYPAGGFQNPPPSEYPMQGGYDFSGSEDHSRMWAAAEIHALTADEDALARFTEIFERSRLIDGFTKMDWADPYAMALCTFLESAENRDGFYREVQENFREQADRIVNISESSLFHTSLRGRNGDFAYVWGSNQAVSANGVELLMAYRLFHDEKYRITAGYQLHYLLGSNGLSRIFITGAGSNPPENPHHNLSIHLGRAIPGIVTEGPDGASGEGSGGDRVLKKMWNTGTPAALCYADSSESWATNEPTIDANASFTALISYFAAE